jgi:hypothetical protein
MARPGTGNNRSYSAIVRSSSKTLLPWSSRTGGLPPILGQIGSFVFFAALFSFAHTDADGYEMFRKCHGNCVNGLLHLVGMPLAVSGVFLIVRAASNHPIFTRLLQFLVVTRYLSLYRLYETNPYSPWLFYVLYMTILDGYMYRQVYIDPSWSRSAYWCVGVMLIVVNVGALEVIGHGLYEHHHSYVGEFFNSVFHTPLYGVNSLLTLVWPRSDHVCW